MDGLEAGRSGVGKPTLQPKSEVHSTLEKILRENPETTRRLRALWALHVTGGVTEEMGLRLLKESDEFLCAWAIQFLAERKNPSEAVLKEFVRLAEADISPVVRLYLATAAQRLPTAQREAIVSGLITHAEDAQDQNLPLMYWYALEPVVGKDPAKAAGFIGKTRIPLLRQFITRRVASGGPK